MSDPTSPSPPRRLGCIILAAGPSSRMGTPKQLIEFRGAPLVVHAVQAALEAPVWPVIVVLGAHAERIRPVLAKLPVLAVENPAWPEGMASSIRCGIASLGEFSRDLDGGVLALCDQPAFSAEAIRRLLRAQHETGLGIAAARYSGRNGAPALFSREYFPELLSLTGETGARTLLNRSPDLVASVEMPELELDLDTPADCERLR